MNAGAFMTLSELVKDIMTDKIKTNKYF